MSKIIKNIIVLLSIFAMSVTPLSAMAKDSNYVVNIKSNFTQKLFENNTSNKEIKGLLALLELAQKEDMSLLTPDFAIKLQKAIDTAVSILANPDGFEQLEIDKAEGELAKLLGNIQYDQVRELRELVARADMIIYQIRKYDLNIYTESSLRGLNEPLAGAKVVLNSMSNDQAAAKRVYTKLNTAVSKLRLIQADSRSADTIINEMTILIDQAKNVKAYDYTSESYKLVRDAKNEALDLLDYQVYPIDTFRLASASLQASLDKLVANEKSDREKLENLLTQVKELDATLYTKASFEELEVAIKLSEELLEKEVVEDEEKDYMTSLNLLQDKRDGLKKLSEEKDDDLFNPQDPNKDPDKDPEIVNPAVESNNTLFIALLVGGIVLLVGVGYFTYLHRLKNKQDLE